MVIEGIFTEKGRIAMASSSTPSDPMLLTLGDAERSGSRWSGLASLVGLVACGLAFFFVVQAIGPERLRAAVAATGPLAPIAYVLLKALTVVITPVSGTPLRLAAGTLFGFWEGVVLSVVGSVLGGSANFWIARRFGRPMVVRLLGPNALSRVDPLLGRLADWRALVLVRIVLAPLWDIISYGVGLTRLHFRTYLVVAILCDIIPSMILVGVGTSVAEVGMIETGTASARAIEGAVPVALMVVALGLGTIALIVAAMVLRPRLARRLAQPAPRPRVIAGTRPVDERGAEADRLAS
jgi:uncharacterized membrane protein YdjX (TVP38/TMEM64 family)